MIDDYEVIFAGVSSADLCIFAVNRPNIPAAERDIETLEVPGVDGAYHIDNGRYKEMTISIEMNYIGPESKWHEKWREIKRWAQEKNAELILNDDPVFVYRAYYAVLSENSRESLRVGKFTITFYCSPYLYVCGSDEYEKPYPMPVYWGHKVGGGGYMLTENGQKVATKRKFFTLTNEYDTSCPKIKIEGHGECWGRINGNELLAQVNGTLIIDTEKEITVNGQGRNASNAIRGNYEDFYLNPGENVILFDSTFEISIAPRWRTR